MSNFDIIVIAIAGPSGSGKSSLAHALTEEFGQHKCQMIELDNYYRDLKHLSFAERAVHDFDHPDAWESERIIEHVSLLKNSIAVDIPQYDFNVHARAAHTHRVYPSPFLVLEGLFALCYAELMPLVDLSIFVDIDDASALSRRIHRDVIERCRTKESVIEQFETTVLPANKKYIRPSAKEAQLQFSGKTAIAQSVASIMDQVQNLVHGRP